MTSRCTVLVVVTLLLGGGAAPALAIDWNQALTTYARDPYRNRRAILALRRADPGALPPLHLLALGEASLRGRRYAAARGQFTTALERGLGEPWDGWARVGLAWIALAQEDYPEARRQFQAVAESPASPSAGLARYGAALLDAAAEEPDTAALFEAVAADPQAAPDLRRAARLGAAYAAYWQEDYAGAAAAFDAFTVDPEVGTLWDDARYAAAWARLRAGEREAAESALAALASGRSGRRRSPPQALVNLEPQAIIRAGFERYRRGPLAAPEQQLARVLDGDGYELAAGALRRLGDSAARPLPAPLSHVRARSRNQAGVEQVTVPAVEGSPGRLDALAKPTRSRPEGSTRLRLAALSAILVLALVLWWRRTRQLTKDGRR